MYLHIGQDTIINSREIIGIFDLDNTTVSKITRETLRKSEKDGRVVTVGYDLPKTFLLCAKNKDTGKIFISPVSASTIVKRLQSSAV